MAAIRYLKITLHDGTRFILRITSDTHGIVRGYEVNAEGDEIVPSADADRRLRIVSRSLIKKSVELRMNPTYATLEPAPHSHAPAKIVNLVTDTTTLAIALYPEGGLDAFNTGVYPSTTIPVRKLTGHEVVVVVGTTASAKIIAAEPWISDRFGTLGARQIKRLQALTKESWKR